MNNELIFRIALTCIPNIGDIQARILIHHFGEASSVFKSPLHRLEKINGIGTVRAKSIRSFRNFSDCEKEADFITKHRIQPLFITDANYPRRLHHCYDAPLLLYYKGNADLNAAKIISVVGTRHQNEYGTAICQAFVEACKEMDAVIISGLAFGIDTIAHRTALKHNIPTVAALAHGLDRIYPTANRSLAAKMTEAGGLITDFRSGTNPDRQNFPKRNRIVAGLCDCLVVIQSGAKGGSLITANLASDYNRDVFAMPGSLSDPRHEGCHELIRDQKAELITSAADLMEKMNWTNKKTNTAAKSPVFAIEGLSENEKLVINALNNKDHHIDELLLHTGLGNSTLAATLLELEMKSCISSLPGRIFKLAPGIHIN